MSRTQFTCTIVQNLLFIYVQNTIYLNNSTGLIIYLCLGHNLPVQQYRTDYYKTNYLSMSRTQFTCTTLLRFRAYMYSKAIRKDFVSGKSMKSTKSKKCINLSINQSINLSIYQSINLSIFQSFNLSIYQSINLSIYQSINQSIYQSINLSI